MTLRTKVYQNDGKVFCFSNCGACGTVTVTQNAKSPQGGFTVSPQSITVQAGEIKCFAQGERGRPERSLEVGARRSGGLRRVERASRADVVLAQYSGHRLQCKPDRPGERNGGYNTDPLFPLHL